MLKSVQKLPLQFHSKSNGIVTLSIQNTSGTTLYIDSQYSERLDTNGGLPIPAGQGYGPIAWEGDLFIGINPDAASRADFIIMKSERVSEMEQPKRIIHHLGHPLGR